MKGTIILKKKKHLMNEQYTGKIKKIDSGYHIQCNVNGKVEEHIIPDTNIVIINLDRANLSKRNKSRVHEIW